MIFKPIAVESPGKDVKKTKKITVASEGLDKYLSLPVTTR
jgi:hypothetical protein